MSYSESLSKLLASAGAAEGCKLSIKSKGREYTGILMPRHDLSALDTLLLKLDSGYNVGIRMHQDSKIEVLGEPTRVKLEPEAVKPKKGLRNLVMIGTGGTISCVVDFKTGKIQPALTAAEMIDAVPEITEIANFDTRVLFSMYSEGMGVEHWQKIASAVEEEINNGADGVIIPHGTDTMGYTAAALSFMLNDVTKPVVLVGAQRSSDRPSTDAIGNLKASARFCVDGDRAGVFVVMQEGLGDDRFAVHCGTRVRKMHTSRRDAFRSINASPVAIVDMEGKIEHLTEGRKVSKGKIDSKTDMEEKCILLQYFPGMDPAMFRDAILGSKGVVIAGTGLGHVNRDLVPLLEEATNSGAIVVMTSQCLGGATNHKIYGTGHELSDAGVITVGDMLPETAYVKLMWTLANSNSRDQAIELMKAPLAGETSDRRTR